MGTNAGAYNHHWNGDILKELMDKAGITAKYFAEKSGLSVSSINNFRLNKTAPSVDNLIIIANFFDVPLDYLCGRYSEKDAKAFIVDYPKYYEQLRVKDFEGYLEKKSEYRNKADGWEAPYPYNLLDDIFCEPFDHIISDDEFDGLNAMIETLHPKEQICIRDYYENGKTIANIGDSLNVTSCRIHQIIGKSLRKLRHPSRSNTIKNGLKNNRARNEYYSKLNDVIKREAILKIKEDALEERIKDYEEKRKILVLDADYVAKKLAESDPDILSMPIEEMDLSVRSFNCLKRANINTLEDFISKICDRDDPYRYALSIPNLGSKSLDEIIDKCSEILGFNVRLAYFERKNVE